MDELAAIDEALAETDPLRLISAIIAHGTGMSPAALAGRIARGLDRAGYEIRPKPDLIPIRRNPVTRL